MPSTVNDCLGTSSSIENISMVNSNNIEINALSGNAGMDKTFARLIDKPTNNNPVKVAAAPAVAAKRLFHSFMKDYF
jgi:hypothetical protein